MLKSFSILLKITHNDKNYPYEWIIDSGMATSQKTIQKPPFWYQLLLLLIVPLYRLRVWQRSKNEPDYQAEVSQRFLSHTSTKQQPARHQQVIWIHAVSVGETNAAQPIIDYYLAKNQPVLVTNTTRTGQARVRELFAQKYPEYFESVFLSVDTAALMQQFIAYYQPRLLILIETELWPNLLSICHAQGIPTALMNARLSVRSARGYGKFARLTKPMLQQLSLIAAQDQDTAQRFIALGASADQVRVTGSIKFDLHAPAHLLVEAAALKQQWGLASRQVIVAASTHEPEEFLLLEQFKKLLFTFPKAVLIIVPRHPQRFESVATMIVQQSFKLVRRSQQQAIDATTQVYLADSMGELWQWFALANIAFVGGSLSDNGGHNPLEPARLGVPVVMGPNTFNFKQIVDILMEAGAMQQAASANDVLEIWQNILSNPQLSAQMSAAAITVMDANQGALQKQIQLLDGLL
jgi:3-deoxy-D-manno-octulosonic-acid transferase